MSKILIFGDSFSCEYDRMSIEYVKWKGYVPKNFPELLSDKLNLKYFNFAQGGFDNYTIFHSIINNIKIIEEDDIVIIGWSLIERFRLVNDKNWISIGNYSIDAKIKDISSNTILECLSNRLTNSDLYIQELNNFIFIINSLLKNNIIIHWSWTDYNANFTVPYIKYDSIKNETNIDDLHHNEKSAVEYYNLFLNFLKVKKKLKINFAFDDILIYDTNYKPLYYDFNVINLKNKIEDEYNIKFPYTIVGKESKELLSIFNILDKNLLLFDNTYNNIFFNTVKYFIKNNEKFLYPIILSSNDLFNDDIIDLHDDIIYSVRNNICKIVFIYPLEGNFGFDISNYIWINKLSTKYNLSKKDIIVITPNMKANETYLDLISKYVISDNYTIYTFSFFSNFYFMFKSFNKLNIIDNKNEYNEFFNILNNNRKYKKEYHFLCFNREPKIHRLCIFAELNTNINFKNKFITSLKRRNNYHFDFYKNVDYILNDNYKHCKNRLTDFYKNYNSDQDTVYDTDDLLSNEGFNLNIDAHNKSFVNIITESHFNDNSIFFSEKTFKPIFCCQPFIIFGTPFMLKKLKEMGFKTFDKWWDESYDNEIDFTKRFEKIIDVMIEISSWNMEKCYKITNEMEKVLQHNFNVLMNNEEIIDLYNFLNCNDKSSSITYFNFDDNYIDHNKNNIESKKNKLI